MSIRKNQPVRAFLLAFAVFFSLAVFAQKTPPDKLDMAFRSLITQRGLPAAQRKAASPFPVEPRLGFDGKGGPLEARYDCIVYTKLGKALRDSGFVVYTTAPNFVTAWVTLDQVEKLASMKEVSAIQVPDVHRTTNDIAVANSGAALLQAGRLNNTVYKGKGVIVAIFDTGIDWDHPDFRDPVDQTKSRILRIWDQTLTPIAGETSPSGMGYGVEYTQAQIEAELNGSNVGYVREKDVNGHGTHVAGTAAGNGMALTSRKYSGMAPEADLVIIKGGNGSFSSSDEVNALTYLQNLAVSLGKPIVLNMSIGGQSGPHDGTTAPELAVNSFTSSGPGRVVVISAGNENGTNIHNQFSLPANGSSTVSFSVPSGTAGSNVFEYRVYLNNNASVSATVTAPATVTGGGGSFTQPANQNSGVSVSGGNFGIFINNSIDPSNSLRYVDVYISKLIGTANPTGTWTLDVNNGSASAVTCNGWLYYISTSYATTAVVGGDNNMLVGTPGTANNAITAAAYSPKVVWTNSSGSINYYPSATSDDISTFSSRGPRRDGAQKPDLAADGQAMVSCLSSDMSPAADPSYVVVSGLYHVEQGTSMSAPVISGACALLLQGKPSATYSEIKTALTSNANKDQATEAPGATPNATWGYGKLDVFKAASSLFGCTPAIRNEYIYDGFTPLTTGEANVGLNTAWAAVRYTTSAAGKVGGAYIFISSATSFTSLTVEVRNNNSGVPGTVLGSKVLPAADVNLFGWTYIDLSSLDISVANGADFFVVAYANSGAIWAIRSATVNVDSRSLASGNSGGSWAVQSSFDFKIRAVVYSNSQVVSGTIASSNVTDTRDINTSQQFMNSCALIAQLAPNGTNPVSGTVAAKVWIEGSVPSLGGQPFVARHYEITPSTSPSTATGRVTLYFTQAEFTAFNSHPASTLDLPTGPGDSGGISNLRIGKYSGTSGNGTGLPNTYTGTSEVINPVDADIKWNAAYSRWEVTFDVTDGFSGFIVQTSTLVILPVELEYFTGVRRGTANQLNWKANCSAGNSSFEVQRSADGNNASFVTIGTVATTDARCQQPFDFSDASPLPGRNYYRLRITDPNSVVKYSGVVMLQSNQLVANSVYPTQLAPGVTLQVSYGSSPKGSFVLFDGMGRQVYSREIISGVQSFEPGRQPAGVYLYVLRNEVGENMYSGKLVIQ